MPGTPKRWTSAGRDTAIAATMLAVATFLLLTGTAADGDQSSGAERDALHRDVEAGVVATLPAGWHAIDRPLDTVVYPPQVLAAASFGGAAPSRPSRCSPDEALEEMPPRGAMVQVQEYTPHNPDGEPIEVPDLPHAPDSLTLDEMHRSVYECAGKSYGLAFERDGRAFQAQIWLDPDTVDPANRAKALRVLNSFRPIAG